MCLTKNISINKKGGSMRRIFSYFLIALFVFAWSANYAADKEDESKINIRKVALKHSVPTHILGTKDDVYLEEGFENGIPANWMNIGMETQWKITDDAFSGDSAVYHNDDNISDVEYDTLMTPPIDLSTATAPMLYFAQKNKYASWYEYHGVLVSTDTYNWTEIYTGAAADDWEIISLSLDAYAGSTVYIAFVYAGDYADEWYVDDVMVAEAPADPILSINYTYADFGLVEVDSTKEYYGFVVSNDGGGTLMFTNVSGLEGTDFYTDFDPTIALGPGEADTFAIGFQPLSEGSQYAELIFESNGGTDTIAVDGFGVDLNGKYVEGFDDAFPPMDWENNILNGTFEWDQYSAAWAMDGEYVARYNSYSASSGYSAELVSRPLDLRGQQDPYVAFYFAHPTTNTTWTDSIDVYFSDGDTNWVYVMTLQAYDYYWHSYVLYVNDYVPVITDSTNFRVKFVATSDYGQSLYLDHVIMPPYFEGEQTVDWCNLQWPPVIDAIVGDTVEVYGQVFKAGVTEGPGQGAGIEAWIGLSTEDTDPATWPEETWMPAMYNEFGPTDANDEYMARGPVDVEPGTYYYTFRYRYNGGPFSYGGYNESGGGFWDGVTNVSGILNVEPDMHPAPTDFVANDGIGSVTMTWNYVAPPEPNAFYENFEDSVALPADWQAIDNDGDGYNWFVWDQFAHSGNNSVASFSYINNVGPITPDNWLITPQIDLGDSPMLSFWAGASDESWYLEHFQVLVSTTDDSLGSFTDVVMDMTLPTAAFSEYTVDLSAYANQSIYIAFVHNNVTDQFNLSLDDIMVTGIAEGKTLDFAFENPNDIKQFKRVTVVPGDYAPLKKAPGMNEQSYKERLDKFEARQAHKEFVAPKGFDHFNVYRDGEVIGTTDTTYFEDFGMPEYNTPYGYYVTAVYFDGVESAPSNIDSALALDPSQVIFMNSFEDGELPSYYTVVNANGDDYTWEAYHGYALTGEYSMAIRWNSSMAMDDWVFIGPIQMYGGENYNLNFGYRAGSSTWTENMAVFVASDIDTSEANMVELFREEGIGNTNYEYYGTEFSIATDGQYYIAFHGYSAPDMYRLAVDDILLMGNGELVGQQDSSIVFFDDFENGTANWQLLGGWGLTESEFVSPTHSFTESPNGNYPDNAVYLATMNEGVDLSQYFDAQVEFMTKYEIEQGFDYMYLEITYDGAKSWMTLASFDGVVTDWTQVIVPLGGFVGHTGVKLRFRFVSDAGYNMDGMYIDDFTIRVSNEDTTPPLVVKDCPQDYEGTIGDFILDAQITDISGVDYANIIYATVEGTDTSAVTTLPADSVMGDTYFFHVPQQEPGTHVIFGLVVADGAGNVDTVGNGDGPCEYIAGNYLNFDDNEVTYVLNVPQNYMVAKRMSIPEGTQTHLVTALIRNYTDAGRPNGNILVHVWADAGGVPGEDLITPFEMVPAANLVNPYQMTVADLRDVSNILWMSGDFWIGFEVPGDEVWLTLGRELDDTRSFVYDPTNGQWAMYSREFQFRAITDDFYPANGVGETEIPKTFELMQNYPNPFNPTTIIKYGLPKEAHVSIKVYNALGQEVATLVNNTMEAGYHEITFDASHLASGMYIYRIQAGDFVAVKKMLLLK